MPSYNLGTASGRIVIDGSAAEAGFSVASAAARSFYDAIGERVEAVDRLGTRLTAIGVTGVAGFGSAVKVASEFEAQLDAVSAVSGATEKQMEAIRAKALQLGADTAFSASESAAAFEILVKAGVPIEDVLNGAAEATVNLAAASGVDMTQAAEVAANALNVFNLEGKDMVGVSDLIAGAANASAIDVTDFAYSLSSSGAVAHLAGLDFKDLSVAIAEMGQAGIKGSDAGTSLKTFLSNLIPSTKAQTKEFQRLGLMTADYTKATQFLSQKGIKPLDNDMESVQEAFQRYVAAQGVAKIGTAKNRDEAEKLAISVGGLKNQFFDASGNVKKMADIQEVLKEATKGMTKEQKLASLELLFGSDAIRAAAVLSEEGAQGYNKMAAAMGKVTAAEVAETRLSNLSGAVEQLKGAFESARIIIGSYFLPILTKLVNGLTVVVNLFNDAPQWVKTTIVSFLGLFTAGSLLLGILIKLSFILVPLLAKFLGFRVLRQTLGIFTTFVKVLRGGGGIVAAATAASVAAGKLITTFARLFKVGKTIVTVIRGSALAMTILTGPIGIAIAAVLLLVAGLFIAYKKFEGFRNVVDNIGRALRDGFIKYVEWAKKNIMDLVAGFKSGVSSGSGLSRIYTTVGAALRFLWESAKLVYDMFMKNVVPALRDAGNTIMASLRPAVQSIREAFVTQVIPALKQLWNAVQTQLVPAFKSMVEALRPALAELKKLWPQIQPIVKLIGIVLVAAIGLFFYAWFKIVQFMLTKVWPVIIRTAGVVIAFLITWLAKFAVFMIGTVLPAILRFYTFMVGKWAPVFRTIGTIIGWWWGIMKTVWSWILGTAIPAIGTFYAFMFKFWVGVFKVAWEIVQTWWNIVKTVFAAVWGFIFPILNTIWTGIVFWAKAVWNGIKVVFDLIGAYFGVVVAFWKLVISLGLSAIYLLFEYVLKPVYNFIVTLFTAISAFFVIIWKSIYNFVAPLVKKLVEGIVNYFKIMWVGIQIAFAAIVLVARTWWAVFSAFWTTIINFLIRGWTNCWNAVKALVTTVLNLIRGLIQTFINAAKAAWDKLLTIIPDPIKKGFTQGTNAVKNGVTTILGIVRKLPGQILSALGNLGSLLFNAGKSLIQGFVNGIKSMLGALKNTLSNITKSLPKQKGPPRVDRKILERNGELVMEGFRKGLKTGTKGVFSELQGLTAALSGDNTLNVATNAPYSGGSVRGTERDGSVLGGTTFARGAIQVNAPQTMSPAQVGQQVAVKTAYKLSTATTSPRIPGVTDR